MSEMPLPGPQDQIRAVEEERLAKAKAWSADLFSAVPYIKEKFYLNLQIVQEIAENPYSDKKVRLEAVKLFAELSQKAMLAAVKSTNTLTDGEQDAAS